ncbi:MAG: hypothetical protein ABII26_10695 [Pseudomonadota bacterium]
MDEQDPKNSHKSPSRVTLTVRASVIRDGTQGISLSIGDKLLGEWTDHRASRLSLTEELKVAICRSDGEKIYLFSAPGRVLSGDQVSDTEVALTFELG